MAASTVDEYLLAQKSPKREICQRLRALILKNFPSIREEMKMGVPWYGGRFYIVALKDHVNLGFSIEGLSKKELSSFEGNGKLMRHIKVFPGPGVDEKRIVALLNIAKKSKCSCACAD